MIRIRPEKPEDYDAVHRINRDAFGREVEATLVEALRRRPEHISELSLVAFCDARLVGHILFSPLTIEFPSCVTPAIALAPLAVDPPYQRKGVDSALVRRGLDAAHRLGHRLVIVIGHADYYPRFGFVPARPFGIDVPFPCPDEAFMLMELVAGAMKGVGGMVRYPAEFSEV